MSVGIGNPIKNRQIWTRQREAALRDPGRFHGEIAKREIFWFDPSHSAWVKRVDGSAPWVGFDSKSGIPCPEVGRWREVVG